MPTATFSPVDARRGSSTLLAWVEFKSDPYGGGSPKTYRWSHVTIPDVNATLIKGRLIEWGSIVRALSDRQGHYEGSRFTWSHADVDREILSLMDDVNQRYLQNRIATVQLITDADRRNGVTPLTVFRGVVRKVAPDKRRKIAWEAEDYLATEFSTSNDQEQLPRRRISTAFFPDAPSSVVGLPEPNIYGTIDDPSIGLVPCIPVGTEVISGTTWTRFLVQGAASKAYLSTYIGGTIWSAGQIGVDILAPGFTGWPFGTLYRDITAGSETRRYTLIYARGPVADNAVAGTAPLTCNISGIESVGDGTGTLLTDITDQYQHWYLNFAIQNYTSGAWLGNPPFHPVLDTTTRLSTAAFASAKAALAARIGGGYIGAGVIGNNGDLRAKGDWIQAWNQSADVRSGFNLAGQFIIAVPDAGTPAATYTQMDDIISESFNGAPLDWDSMFNVLPYNYKKNYASGAWLVENAQVIGDTSIAAYKTTKTDSAVNLEFIRDATIAENNMAAGKLARMQHPARRPIFDTGIYGLSQTDLGQTINVTHADGPGGSGWTNRRVFVGRITAQPRNGLVTLEGEDLDGRGTLSYSTKPGYPGTGSSGSLNFNVGGSPTVTVAVATSGPRSLGGQLEQLQRGTSFQPVLNRRIVKVDWSTIPSFNVRANIESFITDGTKHVQVEVTEVDVTGTTIIGTAGSFTAHNGTTPTLQNAVLTRGTGIRYYLLRDKSTDSSTVGYTAAGELEYVPI